MVARNRVLLLLNVQEGALADILLDASAATKVKNNITTILNYARNEVEPPPLIVHVRNAGDAGDIDEPGTPGWQLVHKPLPGERLVDKRRIDAFAGTELAKLIPEDAKIVVVGLQSDLSVRATCGAALNRGDEVLLIRGSHMTSVRILPEGGITPAHMIEQEIEVELEEAGVVILEMKDLPLIFADIDDQ